MRYLILTTFLVLNGCSHSSERELTAPVVSIQLDISDAEQDADKAIKNGDFRLLAIRRYTIEIPGVNLTYEEASHKYGVREIDGTSDSWKDENEAKFNRNAAAYAKAYNARIIAKKLL